MSDRRKSDASSSRPTAGESQLRLGRRVVETAEAHAALAAQLVAQALCRRLEEVERVSLFLPGGSTPGPTFRRLAAVHLPWDRVEFFWSDERCVPPDDPQSNFALAEQRLLKPIGAVAAAVHRIPAELGAETAARRYEIELRRRLVPPAQRPDVIVLGVGGDGHTASLFGSGAVEEGRAWVVATEAPQPPKDRVSLTVSLLSQARELFFLVAGDRKSRIVARVLGGEEDGAAAAVARRAPRVTWILDEAAARDLA